MSSRDFWCWPVIAVALASAGCRSKEALEQDCLEGETASCLRACDRGVTGEGGCFDAAQEQRRRALLEFVSPAWKEARRLFGLSCDGGHAQACTLGAEMLEAPFLADETRREKGMISDSEMVERQRLLARACDLGSKAGCKRLGDVTIGKNSETARAALEKACGLGVEPTQCKAARQREVAAFEHYRAACKKGAADDCTALGNLVFRVDIPRAQRLFSAEADLRGVAPLVGGVDEFVRQRAAEARGAVVADPSGPPAPAPPEVASEKQASVRLDAVTVEGRLSRSAVERAVRDRLGDSIPCTHAPPEDLRRPSRVVVELIVDRTGDIWRISIVESTASATLDRCVAATFSDVSFLRPVGRFATVRCSMSLGS